MTPLTPPLSILAATLAASAPATAAAETAAAPPPLWLAWAAAPTLAVLGSLLIASAFKAHRAKRRSRNPANPAGPQAHPDRPRSRRSSADPELSPPRVRRWRLGRRRTPLAPPEERAFDGLANRFKLDRRTRRLVRRLAAAVEAKPVALLLSTSALHEAVQLLDDPPQNSGRSPLTLDERRRLLTLLPSRANEAESFGRPTRAAATAGPASDRAGRAGKLRTR